MEDLFQQIAAIENWLRDKPHAGQEEKSEMISRLRELNDKLNNMKVNFIMLNEGKSPLLKQINESK